MTLESMPRDYAIVLILSAAQGVPYQEVAVIVGKARLSFRGQKETIRVETPMELGELVLGYADLLKAKVAR